MSEYVPDVRTREKPRRTAKYSGDRQIFEKIIQKNYNEDGPRHWGKNGGKYILKMQEMFIKNLEELKNKENR